jgi:transposase
VISGISISPRRRHLGLYFRLHLKNIQHPEVCEFLRHLLRHLRGPVLLIWDSATIHKGEAIRALCSRFPRLHLYHFPGYAPELNPDEGVWKLAKQTLATGARIPRTNSDVTCAPR